MTIETCFACATSGLPRVDEAIALLTHSFAPVTQSVRVALHKAVGRVLAEDAVARVAVPPCDRSAMDGYAFRYGSGAPLRLVGRALAGKPFPGLVDAGECVAIATGASLPRGCDTVAMREHCRDTAHGVTVAATPGANVRRRGEDFHAGAVLVTAGTRLDARHIALLASGGVAEIMVTRRLRVAILSVGDELAADAPDRICDANRAMLAAFCESLGTEVTDLGILSDDRRAIADFLGNAAGAHDVILGSAGTSVGDEDHVRGAVRDGGGEILIAGVAIKPGKPVAFGRLGQCAHVALPGNPAAAFVTFAALGLPLLRHIAGVRRREAVVQKVRADFAHRKKKGLREYLRVALSTQRDGAVDAQRVPKDGAAMLSSLTTADGFVCLDEDTSEIAPGALVSFRSFADMMAP